MTTTERSQDVIVDPATSPVRSTLIVATMCLAGVGLGAAALAGQDGARIVDMVQSAVTDGFGLAMWVAAGAAIAGAFYVALRIPPAGAEASALDAPTAEATPGATRTRR